MPTRFFRNRPGRLIDGLAIALFAFVFLGLAVFHYVRNDRRQQNDEKLQELAKQPLEEERPTQTDWPQWRGPNRDGVSTETGLLAAWPNDGPKLLWEQQVGEGFASVAVARGRVFTIFQENENETIVCWDAAINKEYWRHSYPCYFKNPYGNGPRATPTVAGDRIYVVGGTGIMHCLNWTTDQPGQRVVWKKDLPGEFGAAVPKWGVAFSPLVDDQRVFILPGGPQGNSLAALDPATGAVLWKQHDDPPGYSSPIAATLHGQRQILFFTGIRLVSVHPETGAQLWDYAWPIEQNCNIATPIVVKDYVFISSGYGRGCAMLKIDKVGDAWQPTLVYKNRHMRNHFSSSVRHKDYLFGFDDSNLVCMNFRTGAVLWKERGFDKGSVLLVDDRLIIYGEKDGVIALAETNPQEYREISRFAFSTQRASCWSVPVVANGRLYVRDQRKLACFDVKAEK